MKRRTIVIISICTLLIVIGFILFVRDWNGVRLLAVFPKILKYRPVIQKHAVIHRLDWRLIAALIVQESGFDENAESAAGAQGLMQLMPKTAKELGVSNPFASDESIAGATRYLRNLYDLYPESSPPNRIRIALASYNGGRGRIKDAQKIAIHRGEEPHQWESISVNLGLLTKKDTALHAEIWESSAPPHGYFRGYKETREYVKRVMLYYARLCHFSKVIGKVKSLVNL